MKFLWPSQTLNVFTFAAWSCQDSTRSRALCHRFPLLKHLCGMVGFWAVSGFWEWMIVNNMGVARCSTIALPHWEIQTIRNWMSAWEPMYVYAFFDMASNILQPHIRINSIDSVAANTIHIPVSLPKSCKRWCMSWRSDLNSAGNFNPNSPHLTKSGWGPSLYQQPFSKGVVQPRGKRKGRTVAPVQQRKEWVSSVQNLWCKNCGQWKDDGNGKLQSNPHPKFLILASSHQGATSQRCAFSHEAMVAPYLLDELQKSQRNLQSACVGTVKVSSIFP